jgi:hypothetical protein
MGPRRRDDLGMHHRIILARGGRNDGNALEWTQTVRNDSLKLLPGSTPNGRQKNFDKHTAKRSASHTRHRIQEIYSHISVAVKRRFACVM